MRLTDLTDQPIVDRSTKLLFIGAAIAGVTFGGGYLTRRQDESALASLIAKCKAEVSTAPKGPWLEYQKAPLVCDPEVLLQLSAGDAVGVQKEIVDSASNVGTLYRTSIVAAILLLVGFSAPYAWHFFLRRIRELSAAIRNNS